MTTIDESREGTSLTGPEGEAEWARRLAERRQSVYEADHGSAMRAERRASRAAPLLWTMIDKAVAQANDALARAGLLERIALERGHDEYVLSLPGPEGTQRTITVFASVRAVDDGVVGSASLSTSVTRACIDLSPTTVGERMQWLVATTGLEFSARVMDDLLLSVFSDDPAATGRLGPLYSIGQHG